MDPIFEQLVSDLRTSFEAQKAAQQAVGPLQTAAADANRALDQGNSNVTATIADVETKIRALENYVDNGTVPTEPTDPNPTVPGGGGEDTLPGGGGEDVPAPVQNRPQQSSRRR